MTVTMEDLYEAGCHLGHSAQKWHPKMKPWIYGEQDGIHIFDLEKTTAQLEKAVAFIQDLKKSAKSLVIVATKKQAAELTEKLAIENGVMYVINRWPGGLITNWEQVRRSIRRMNEIEDGLKTGKFKEYTKYERLMMEKELARLERLFGGLKALKNIPDAILVIDAQKEKNCVHEALSEKIDIIALIDSNTDPSGIKLPIPANDDALSSVKLIITELLNAYGDRVAASAKKETVAETVTKEAKEAGEEKEAAVEIVKAEPVVMEKEIVSEKKAVAKKVVAKKAAVKKSVAKTTAAKKATTKKVTKKEA